MENDPYKQQGKNFPDPYKSQGNEDAWSQADHAAQTQAHDRERATRNQEDYTEASSPHAESETTSEKPRAPEQRHPAHYETREDDQYSTQAPEPEEQPNRKRNWTWIVTGLIFVIIILLNTVQKD